jgi:hypothetical protein
MWFSSILCWPKMTRKSTPRGRPEPGPSRRPRRPFRPTLEVLEDRCVPATTFTVTNLNDAGPGSLRQAIADSNAIQTDADTIVFQPGLTGNISLTTGQLNVTGPVTILGPGSGKLAISGNNQSRIFEFDNGSPSLSHYDLSGMTLTGGQVKTGIQHGGAIEVASETLFLRDVVIANNFASGEGGGLFVGHDGFLLMDDCTVNGNISAGGGGLFLEGDSTASIRTSTISRNNAIGSSTGGGIFYGGGPGLAIENSTISGNTASNNQGGGGIRLFGPGPVRIVNSTIAFNIASFTGAGNGGGISVNDFAGPVTLVSTIVADNLKGPEGFYPDIFATGNGDVSADHSLVGDTAGSLVVHFSNSLVNVDPRLGRLANNGGPTLTHALLPGSPAINAGLNPAGLLTDQRGPGFVRTVGTGTDIGAFEVQSFSSPRPLPQPLPVVEIQPLPVVEVQVTRVKRRTRVDVVVDGELRRRSFPFGSFTGRVQVLQLDVNGDGLPDVIASAIINGKKRTRTFTT